MAHEDLGFVEDNPHADLGFVPSENLGTTSGEPESIGHGLWRAGLRGAGEAIASQSRAAKASGKPIEGSVSLAIPEIYAPSALLSIVKALGGSAPRRIATNAALGAAQGAMRDPGDDGSRLTNAATGAAIAGGTSGLLEGVSKAVPILGGKLMNINHDKAEAYAANPKLAEELYSKFESDPEGLNQDLRSQIRDALYGENSIFEKKSAPLLQKRGELLAGKNISILPDQFKGTAAESELQRMINAMNPQEQVPSLSYGQPEEQAVGLTPPKTIDSAFPPAFSEGNASGMNQGRILQLKADIARSNLAGANATGFDPYNTEITVPVSEVSESLSSAPNAKVPESLSVTAAQGQRLKKILQEAADYKRQLNPIGYSSANDSEALGAGRLRKALEGVAPDVAGINDELGRNARMEEAAKAIFGQNPARILNNSKAIGNTNTRSLQNYLDENAGTNFAEMADAMAAGRAVNNESRFHSPLARIINDPIGRALLKNSSFLNDALQSPVIPQSSENAIERLLTRKRSNGPNSTLNNSQ